jgi:serine/threonine protein kinase
MAGEVFAGRYEIQHLLGEGDRKRTYLARDAKLDRLVAVSVVKPEAAALDPDGTEREAKVLGRIGSHPNVVSLYDYEIDQDGSLQYIVFQYLGGGTLGGFLKRVGRLPLEDLLRLGRQLSRGLSHLHGSQIVHRDVSPDNIWLDERLVAHLGDFDSAITTASGDALRPITTGSFAAPEEHEGWSLDARSDLYSLGGVLLVAATGDTRPEDPRQLLARRPDLPSAFRDLLASLLAKSPDQRPSDADTVLRRLDDIRRMSDIDALIAAGESDKLEIKSSLHYIYQLREGQDEAVVRKKLRWEVTKTIAAFLNSHGGTLIVGVDDSGSVLGIEADFAYVGRHHDGDGWLLSLKDVTINALGPEVWNVVDATLVQYEGKTVAVIRCPERSVETWHQEDRTEHFYIRASNATEELHGSSQLRYIRERWPT